MWIVIRGIRYNFANIESYRVDDDKVKLTPSVTPSQSGDINYTIGFTGKDKIAQANELVDKIDTLLGTQTL